MSRRLPTLAFALALLLPLSAAHAIATTFTYQGTLQDGAAPANGDYDFAFVLYTASIGGSSVGTGPITLPGVAVEDGHFTVQLDFGAEAFDGSDRWLEILVKPSGGASYTTLSPRQTVTATPYAMRALALSGPQRIVEAVPVGNDYDEPDAALVVENTHDGPGSPDVTYSIYAENENSSYDNVALEHSAAVYGRGKGSYTYGVLGDAGTVPDFTMPLGSVGVVGRGSSRGVYGVSDNGTGLYAISSGNYGVWGQSENYRGVTGRTNRTDNNYGFYTPDNIFSLNSSIAGSMTQVMYNGGSASLEPGDVVRFAGVHENEKLGIAVAEVAMATELGDAGVAGVVHARFVVEAVADDADGPDPEHAKVALDATPAGAVRPGEYMLVVIQGTAPVKVDALGGAIRPGDPLYVGGHGKAVSAAAVLARGGGPALASFAKALEAPSATSDRIYAFVGVR